MGIHLFCDCNWCAHVLFLTDWYFHIMRIIKFQISSIPHSNELIDKCVEVLFHHLHRRSVYNFHENVTWHEFSKSKFIINFMKYCLILLLCFALLLSSFHLNPHDGSMSLFMILTSLNTEEVKTYTFPENTNAHSVPDANMDIV